MNSRYGFSPSTWWIRLRSLPSNVGRLRRLNLLESANRCPMPRQKQGLRMMALIEGAKGMLVLAAGLGLFALAHRDLQSMAEQLVRHLHLNPARHLPRIFLHLAANLSDRKLWLFASAAIIYSTIRFVEAYGLWH